MAALFPFRALRPDPSVAAKVAAVPYDVVNTEEARLLASGNSLSFLRVTRSEIDLPAGTDPHAALVYEQAVKNFEELKRVAPFVLEDEPSLYCYRLRMGTHVQTGVAGCFSIDEYERGVIKKHERTRQDKEDDRTRHITASRAQTGLVFLAHRASGAIDEAVRRASGRPPLYDLVLADGVAHTLWRVTESEREALVQGFDGLDALYIADGHHRAASAARARRLVGPGSLADAHRFVAVAFPDNQVQVLAYNRTVKDLGGHSAASLLSALRAVGDVREGRSHPSRKGEVSMFLDGRWHAIGLPTPDAAAPKDAALDVALLQDRILGPLLKIGDPRTDGRLDFVGGVRGAAELERLVTEGKAAVAFSLFPVDVGDLMGIADEGGIMPPKSTWFEPKLRDGLLVHLI